MILVTNLRFAIFHAPFPILCRISIFTILGHGLHYMGLKLLPNANSSFRHVRSNITLLSNPWTSRFNFWNVQNYPIFQPYTTSGLNMYFLGSTTRSHMKIVASCGYKLMILLQEPNKLLIGANIRHLDSFIIYLVLDITKISHHVSFSFCIQNLTRSH